MADLPPQPDSSDDTGVGPDRGSPPGTPLWVKVFGVIFIVLALLFVVLQLTVLGPGGQHGPGRQPSGEPGGQTPPAEHTPPIEQGGHSQ